MMATEDKNDEIPLQTIHSDLCQYPEAIQMNIHHDDQIAFLTSSIDNRAYIGARLIPLLEII